MTTQAKEQTGCEAMGALADEHKALEYFVGTWNAKCTFWMGPGQDPMHSSGVMTNTLVLGGRQLEMRYKGEFGGGEFLGIGFWGFNTTSGHYEAIWMDTACTTMQFESNGVASEDGKIVHASSTMVHPETKQPIRKSTVTTIVNENEHTYVMSFGDEGKEMKTMEIVYTRA